MAANRGAAIVCAVDPVVIDERDEGFRERAA
jgi:hypothetical protein